MPKFEPKMIQKELEQNKIWPVYWIYGGEQMKIRELVKRIKKTAVGDAPSASLFGSASEILEGSEVSTNEVLDSLQSLSLGGGLRFLILRDAHQLKNPEELETLMGKASLPSELSSVLVCLSKDLDARKKFSKVLIEKAAVVSCEEVAEEEKEAWIGYLSKRRGLELKTEWVMRLRALDPWSLDIIDQELEKFSISNTEDVFLTGTASLGGETFLNSFFSKNLKAVLQDIESFAQAPEESLPLLGLLGWNVRQMACLVAEKKSRTRSLKLSPFIADRLQKWAQKWELAEILKLQEELEDLDFNLKQTPLLPLGLWSDLVMRFCV